MGRFKPEELAAWSGGTWHGIPPARVDGVLQDTRRLKWGQLYVAIRGEVHDGHRFLLAAQEAGAAAALVDPEGLPLAPAGLPCLVVRDTRDALASLAREYRRELGLRVAGVTGSVGKTTVKELLAAMCGAAFPTARTQGNWNNDIGLPLSILASARESHFGVFELGMNNPGEIRTLAAIVQPDMAVMTPIGPVHMEAFESERAIAHEKAGLLAALPEHGCGVIWLEEPHRHVYEACTSAPLVTVSVMQEADYQLHVVDGADVKITERATGDVVPLACPLGGEHNKLNMLLAIAGARQFGVTWGDIATGLAAFRPPPMRWERHQIGGVMVINDAYNANPMSMRAALKQFVEEPCAGQRWLVLGGMLELGQMSEDAHEDLGMFVAGGHWAGLITVGNLGARVAAGARRGGFPSSRILEVGHAKAVGDLLSERVEPGDSVLLKGSRGFHLEEALDELEVRMGRHGGGRRSGR
jgi:UDP-N-acetylmuramoyl-tripeptide--D-alanyl-D-alanine ligase